MLKNRNINNKTMALRNAKSFLTDKVRAGVESQTAELNSQFEKVEAKVVTLLDDLVNVKAENNSLKETNKNLNEELDIAKKDIEAIKKTNETQAEAIRELSLKSVKEPRKPAKTAAQTNSKEE